MNELFEGRTKSEAVINACTELEVSRDELEYEIVLDEGEGLNRLVRSGRGRMIAGS